jgi:hypothetical protein
MPSIQPIVKNEIFLKAKKVKILGDNKVGKGTLLKCLNAKASQELV